MAGAFVVYLLTLNHWVSTISLQYVARASGYLWGEESYQPFFYLVTLPLRWVPERWLPLAFNLFSTVCAVLVLGLLARSIALLPHDRTHDQRQRESSPNSTLSLRSAWIPPVLAVFACGLQLTFWEHATAASPEMFNLLVFAYITRNLLEYRIDRRDPWLLRAALVYGAGMTDNWALIGFLPVFLIVLIWIKGQRFFNLRFVTRLFLCGLVGLLLYLFLPLLHLATDGTFWGVLKEIWRSQKDALLSVPYSKYVLFFSDQPLWVVALSSLLPLFVIAIRWASSFGDPSRLGVALTTWIFHLTHAALLGVCLWVAFDPAFSPRNHNKLPVNLTLYYLPFYYLGALSIGYLSGYFLLVFAPVSRNMRRPSLEEMLDRAAAGVVYGLLLLIPAGLIYKNLFQIRFTNGPALKQYALDLTRDLPPHAAVYSDDGFRLILAQLVVGRQNAARDYVFVETHAVALPSYHRFQLKQHPDWPVLTDLKRDNFVFSESALVQLMGRLSEKRPIYYLHPSLGYYFEHYYLEPHRLVFALKRWPTNGISPPLPTEAEFTENEAFWKQTKESIFDPLLAVGTQPAPSEKPAFREKFAERLHLPFEPNATALALGNFYSRALDFWGVQAQRMGRLETAGDHFVMAHDINPNNVVAEINSEFNKKLRAGDRPAVQISSAMDDRLGHYPEWAAAVNDNGPFDEPSYCFKMGRLFTRGSLFRQAAQQFDRVLTLVPDDLPTRMWLARLSLLLQQPQVAMPLLEDLEHRGDAAIAAGINSSELFQLKLLGYFSAHQPDKAKQLLNDSRERISSDTNLLANIVQIHMKFGLYSNALPFVDRELELQPDDPVALVNKGFLHLQLNDFEHAIPPLSRLLATAPTNSPALLNRAIAYLRSGQLDQARADYETLLGIYPNAFPVYYGLGDIAFRKHDTNAAIQYYQQYLTNSPTNPDEVKFVTDRLKALKSGSP
jgi:tetratricopeptide (TPR) repeat protein